MSFQTFTNESLKINFNLLPLFIILFLHYSILFYCFLLHWTFYFICEKYIFYLLLKWPLHCIVFLFIFTLLYVLLTYSIDIFCFKWPLHCIAIYLFLYLLNWIYIIYFMSCHFTWAQICKCNFIVLILDFCITHLLLLLLFVCLFIWGKEIDKRRIKFRNFGNHMQTFVAHTICRTKWNQIFSH